MTDELPRRRGRPPKSSYHAAAPEYQMRHDNGGGEPESVDAPGEVPAAPETPDPQPPEPAAGTAAVSAQRVASYDLAEGWAGMDTAWDDGRPIVVAGLVGVGIPAVTAATMHHSRRWTGSVTRWVPFTEWRQLNSPDRVPFIPLCWTRYE